MKRHTYMNVLQPVHNMHEYTCCVATRCNALLLIHNIFIVHACNTWMRVVNTVRNKRRVTMDYSNHICHCLPGILPLPLISIRAKNRGALAHTHTHVRTHTHTLDKFSIQIDLDLSWIFPGTPETQALIDVFVPA